MGKNEGHNRRRLVDMSSAATPSQVTQAWLVPDPDECDEHVSNWFIGPGEKIWMRLLTDQTDRLVDFAVMQMTLVGNRYVQVARVDSKHGTVHVHQLFRATPDDTFGHRREMFEISCQEDVERGLEAGVDFVTENWEEHKRRWRDGR